MTIAQFLAIKHWNVIIMTISCMNNFITTCASEIVFDV